LEWQFALVIILGGVIFLMATGMPVAFTFLLVSIIGVFLIFNGEAGLRILIPSIRDSVANFVLLPMTSFILMGEVMFRSKMGPEMLDALDKWLGRLPGRLGLLAVGGGTLFSTLTGVSMASIAMLGSSLVPEMEKRGYKKPMSLGPILGSGGLAIMIPPSALAVLLGALTIHGLQPGPMLFRDHLDIIYPIFAGMIMAQFVLLAVGLSGARIFARIINIDRKILTPIIFFLCVVGMVMVIEGLPYFAFPEKMKRMVAQLLALPEKTLRIFGFILMLTGVFLVALGKR